MTPPVPKSGDPQSQLDAPARPELRWIRCCLILFLLSSAAVFQTPDAGPEAGGADGTGLPTVPLAIALASGGVAFLIGLRHLMIRPGAFLILFWFGFLAFTAAAGFLRGGEPAQIARSLTTPLLLGFAVTTTHLAACAGMRAGEAVRYFLIAAGCGLFLQFGLEFLADRPPIHEIKLELPGFVTGFLIAWAASALFLRRAITRPSLSLSGLVIAAAALGVARGMTYPILIPAAGAGAALILGMIWRLFPRDQFWKRFAPVGLLILLGAVQLAAANSPAVPFSGLAEADSAGGIIANLTVAGIILVAMGMSLRAAWRNSETIMGRWARDAHLMFLPFVALLCLLGESLFRHPFDQPFAAVLVGLLMAMPQFFFNRAFYLRHRENEAAIAPQLILNEEDLPSTWDGAFPSNA